MHTTLRLYAVITAILDTCVASIATSRGPNAILRWASRIYRRHFIGGAGGDGRL